MAKRKSPLFRGLQSFSVFVPLTVSPTFTVYPIAVVAWVILGIHTKGTEMLIFTAFRAFVLKPLFNYGVLNRILFSAVSATLGQFFPNVLGTPQVGAKR